MTAHNLWLSETRSIPYWTASVFSSEWLTWFWFTNRSLLHFRCPLVNTPQLNTELSYEYQMSQSELLYDWRFTADQFVLETNPLRPTTSNFIFQLNTCGYNPYVTSSLTRGWVCRLQLLLIFGSAVICGSESRGAHDSRLSQPGGPGPRIYIPQEQGGPVIPPGTGFLFVAS
jgi:hypothetical protein